MKLTQPKRNWTNDKDWSDRFLPEIKRILGEHLIGEPPQEEDALRNTDLIVLRMEAVRIGCRVRHHEYLNKYPNEFTIRAKRPSGNKTELSKIIEGWGQYFFYAFANADESQLAAWLLGDLNVFRLWFSRYLAKNAGRSPGLHQNNPDNSSSFRAFSISTLPDDFIVARLQYEPAKVEADGYPGLSPQDLQEQYEFFDKGLR